MTAAKYLFYKGWIEFLALVGNIGVNFIHINLKPPIFIIGTGRCGTSLLTRILNSHPDIVGFPGEANELWHPNLYPLEQSRIDVPPIEIDPKEFTAVSLRNWPPNHSRRLQAVFEGFHFVKGGNKSFFVKSAMISFMIPQIVNIFPSARFFHIYRNGPSVVRSYFEKNKNKLPMSTYTEDQYWRACCEYWNACILEIDRAQESFGLQRRNAYHEISYEDLCDKSDTTLENIAEYFCVDPFKFQFDPSIIQSRNYKADNDVYDKKFQGILRETIYPAMKLKGYLQ